MVDDLWSGSLENVYSLSVYHAVNTVFEKHSRPWINLMSILMDSCAVMEPPKMGSKQKRGKVLLQMCWI